jgi:hypothetical protein
LTARGRSRRNVATFLERGFTAGERYLNCDDRGTWARQGRRREVLSYPRRQQLRHLHRAASTAAGALAAGLVALAAAANGLVGAAALLLTVAAGLAGSDPSFGAPRRSASGRRRVREAGAPRAESAARRRLANRPRHRLAGSRRHRPRRGHAVRVGFAIETKTRWFDSRHIERTRATAAWLARRHRSWCNHGVLPVLCVVRRSRIEHVHAGVFVVSVDRLMSNLLALQTSDFALRKPGRALSNASSARVATHGYGCEIRTSQAANVTSYGVTSCLDGLHHECNSCVTCTVAM